MALVDVIKCQVNDKELCYKFPSDDLRLGTQLVVYPSQIAFFVKGGQICDEFEAGTFTLKTSNIPLLNKLINIPFGSDSPFKAEVWFISLLTKLDIKWGTQTPIQLEDPKYNIIIPVRAYGQYGLKVSDPRLFLTTLIGNMGTFSVDKVDSYFKGKILSSLSALLSQKIAQEGISLLNINSYLTEMSEYCNQQINATFQKYGLEVVEFSFVSINIPQDDPSFIRLKEAKDTAARLKITGRDVYQMERSFDVLDKAAANEGAGGQMIAMGAGLGAGVGFGQAMSGIASQTIQVNPATPPPIPAETTYFIYFNGQQVGGQTVQHISALLAQGQINAETLIWRAGLPSWVKLSEMPELAALLNAQTPPPVPPQI